MIHTDIHAYRQTRQTYMIHIHIHADYIHAYIQTYMLHTYKHTYMHTYKQTYKKTYIQTCMHACMQTDQMGSEVSHAAVVQRPFMRQLIEANGVHFDVRARGREPINGNDAVHRRPQRRLLGLVRCPAIVVSEHPPAIFADFRSDDVRGDLCRLAGAAVNPGRRLFGVGVLLQLLRRETLAVKINLFDPLVVYPEELRVGLILLVAPLPTHREDRRILQGARESAARGTQRAANKSRSASCGLHKSACPSVQEGAAQKVTLSSSRFVGTLSKSPLPLVGCPAPPFFVGIGAEDAPVGRCA